MSGVGEASAIVSVISTAAIISQAVISIASKYKDAKDQIQAFGREVAILGKVLDQLHRRLGNPLWTVDGDMQLLTEQVVEECTNIFTQLDAFKDNLYSKQATVEPGRVTLKGSTKWVFKSTELDFLKARVDSMKINLVLMMVMAMPRPRTLESAESNSKTPERVEQISMLHIQSRACLDRLESLEQRMAGDDHFSGGDCDTTSLATFQTTRTSQSIQDTLSQLSEAIPGASRLSLSDTLPSNTATDVDGISNTSDLVEDFLGLEDVTANACSENERPPSFPESERYLDLYKRTRMYIQAYKYSLEIQFPLYDPKSGTLEVTSGYGRISERIHMLAMALGSHTYQLVLMPPRAFSFDIHVFTWPVSQDGI